MLQPEWQKQAEEVPQEVQVRTLQDRHYRLLPVQEEAVSYQEVHPAAETATSETRAEAAELRELMLFANLISVLI